MSAPRIIKRTETRVSPWVRLVANEVQFSSSGCETYHALAQADYVTIVARSLTAGSPSFVSSDRRWERETWELPAGLLESDELAEVAAGRELLEETGAEPLNVVDLGTFLPDTGRLENRIRVFGVDAAPPSSEFVPEPNISVALVSPSS